jgi:4-hydroxyphenylpyruvate dioxygenase-like putative hemolysin
VKDLDSAVENWSGMYCAGPWILMEFNHENLKQIRSDGKSHQAAFHFRIAASYIGEMQIELIEANETMPMYQEFLEQTGGGLHHFKERIPDEKMEDTLAEYERNGCRVIFGGKFHNITFYYIDTKEKLGFNLEIGNCEKLDYSK